MVEEWRDVVGFEDYFQVSDRGNVFSKRTNRPLRTTRSKKGYWSFSTRIGGRSGVCYCFRVHRLVAEAFLPPPSSDLVELCSLQGYGLVLVRHMDDNKNNNNVCNLAWGSTQDNTDDFVKTAAHVQKIARVSGSLSSRAKVTQEQVEYIRTRYRRHSRVDGTRAIAADIGLHHTSVARIIRRATFKL